MSLTVRKPGLLATVQDLGRFGYQNQGVVVGGAMDANAARIANWLVGNEETEAVLELTLTGAVLYAESDCWIAICGGDMGPVTDESEEVPSWRPVLIAADTKIAFNQYRSGCRAYIALAGGIRVSKVMGSRSTYIRGKFGGMEGRPLRAGDHIETATEDGLMTIPSSLHSSPSGKLKWPLWHAGGFAEAHEETAVIRLMPGAHWDWLSEAGKQSLFENQFRIGVSSDRMGYRLEGNALEMRPGRGELISEPVTFGTVQLPPDGNPIVLLADRQTTGGYPRIGEVASVDLPVLAQLKPGDAVTFSPISHEEAERLLLDAELEMELLNWAIKRKLLIK